MNDGSGLQLEGEADPERCGQERQDNLSVNQNAFNQATPGHLGSSKGGQRAKRRTSPVLCVRSGDGRGWAVGDKVVISLSLPVLSVAHWKNKWGRGSGELE
jgi:hypothetical protein